MPSACLRAPALPVLANSLPLIRCGIRCRPLPGAMNPRALRQREKRRARRPGILFGWSRAPYPPRPFHPVSFRCPRDLPAGRGVAPRSSGRKAGFRGVVQQVPRRAAHPACGGWVVVGSGLPRRAGGRWRVGCLTRCGAGWLQPAALFGGWVVGVAGALPLGGSPARLIEIQRRQSAAGA